MLLFCYRGYADPCAFDTCRTTTLPNTTMLLTTIATTTTNYTPCVCEDLYPECAKDLEHGCT